MKRTALLALLLAAAPTFAAETFQDCKDCPVMVVVESGHFRMGSPADEAGRAADGHEGPQREIQITQRFALGREEVSVGQFKRFVAATGHVTSAESDPAGPSCLGWLAADAKLAQRPGLNWRAPGYPQGDAQPVVCVSWNDAQAYLRWLSGLSGQTYRLASEAEWEYAARAGSSTGRPWGDDPSKACLYANVADETAAVPGFAWSDRHACTDGHFFAAPLGSYRPNAFGLHDMLGNVWEWVQDCYDPAAYSRADIAPDTTACPARSLRGGAWISGPARTRPAYRGGYRPETRTNVFGFRVARSL